MVLTTISGNGHPLVARTCPQSVQLRTERAHGARCLSAIIEGGYKNKKHVHIILRRERAARLVITRRRVLLALLCLAWLLPGLIARDPWKADEATAFGVVYEMLDGGSWVAPSLAGEPFVREPPLYYLTAAASAVFFSPLLPLHDGARLATGFYVALALLFCALAGRELHGPGVGALSAALLLGSFGLVLRSHQIVAGVAGVAGFAMAYYGCARALRGGAIGGLWLGTGLGIVFLSQGIVETVVVALIALVLPLVSSAWRTRDYALALGVALLAALPWLAIWPLMLHTHSPALFSAWLKADTAVGLYSRAGTGLYYLRILPWYAWPLWPLAGWALWRAFGNGPVKPGITLPLAGFLITLLALSESSDKRELYALPLLLPLALLATPGAQTLRRGAANGWYWFSIMGFTFFVLVAWVYWSGMELGVPPRLHAHLQRLQPAYTPGFKWLPFLFGALYTVAWFAVLARLHRHPQRPAMVWAAGVTVTWALLATLFISWLDTGKSYRGMMVSLGAALPKRHACVSTREVGEPQRAMLHYYLGIRGYRDESPERRRDCDLLLVQGTPQHANPPGDGWKKIWEGNRPTDKLERYRLYRRVDAGAGPASGGVPARGTVVAPPR
jgi:4-amino-4-deoxy-L-arabinose transferase-like glycosyltransferase